MTQKTCIKFSEVAEKNILQHHNSIGSFVNGCIDQGIKNILKNEKYYEISTFTESYSSDIKIDIMILVIEKCQYKNQGNADKKEVIELLQVAGFDEDEAERLIKRLKREGSIFEPENGILRIT